MDDIKITVFAGSARKESLNARLAAVAAQGADIEGVQVDLLNMADYPMPLFDEDLEKEQSGMDEPTLAFREKLVDSAGFLIACPEYNSSITPLLKNAIDWASRKPEGGPSSLDAFRGKTALLIAASPGGLGGLRGLNTVRSILTNIGTLVHPSQFALSKAYDAFDENGNLHDEATDAKVRGLGRTLADFTLTLNR